MSFVHIITIPLALAILAALFPWRRAEPQNLPPGPPGRDQTRNLEAYRWNTFKAWNDLYGCTFLVLSVE